MATTIDFPLSGPLSALVSAITASFQSRGVVAYATGGFVRDVLLGVPVNDLDIAIAADPLELGPALADSFGGSFFPLDEERGLGRVMLPAIRPAVEAGVHLDLQRLRGDIAEDLRTRDYTIDAMAAELGQSATGRIMLVDPAGGLADLRNGVVRAVSEANLREDPLRLLRGVRLTVVLGFDMEPETAEMIRRNAALVGGSSAERQRDELMLILGSDRAGAGLRRMDELGLLTHVLPELDVMRGVDQPREHHWDVFNHSLQTVGAMEMLLAEHEPEDEGKRRLREEMRSQLGWWEESGKYFRSGRAAVLKLACLLHDIGKPETKSFQEGGRMRFFGHSEAGARIAQGVLRRLRLPSREVAMVTAMVDAHMRPLQMAQQGAPTNRAIYRFFRDTGDAGVDTLYLSLADHLAAVGPRVSAEGWRRHLAIVSYILRKRFEDAEVVAPPRLISGGDLMAELELPAGPEVGVILEKIREAQAAGEVRTRADALRLAREHVEQSAVSR